MTAPSHDYADVDPEAALKYAVQRIEGGRAEVIEGVIEQAASHWDHEAATDAIRRQIAPRIWELGCVAGSGDIDLPGSSNWYTPDIAVVDEGLAKGGGALLPEQTLLVVEVASESNGDTDRTVKRRRYAEYGAPLYLLVDRQEKACTLFSEPGKLGYARVAGPHPFGTPIRLPEPFDLELDTGRF
ncbi:Uma2 family endonuclease [Streptantibioticus ferralitis]|uniref:Uma2 family endonuclease n=1 Tax=Streptantibioticus ferralitis TaxID=236510 RepID=A0ABT5YRP5_9ACTN|nr:Uma2 family endonuclease [Streptantibioticus ferralitis]MDF2254276.1 Uma2 family endonuclease [Streptantibioticus ferralitis]